ncbi:sugar transferase [soil metagenome]
MKNNSSLVYSLFLVVGDFLAVLAAFVAAYILRVKYDPRPLIEQIPPMDYFYAFVAILPLWILVHAFIGLYRHDIYDKRFVEFGRLLVGSFLGILVVIGYDFVVEGTLFPARLVAVYGLGLGLGLLVVFRSLARLTRRTLFRFGKGISNILVVGDTAATDSVVGVIRNTRLTGLRALAVVGRDADGITTYNTFAEAIRHINQPIHGIIQTELYKNKERNNEILRYSQENHASYRFVPGNSDLFYGNIDVELYADVPMIAVHQTALIGWGRVVKRISDLGMTLLVSVAVLPLILLIAIIMKLLDPRSPVFFKQTRLTRFNREFKVYKFRTFNPKYNGMTPEEAFEAMGKPQLIKEYRENGDFILDDPRFTKFGRFLRGASLDELPQLLNVLKGDLSLVGPRALIPQELTTYSGKHSILSVKSGITGLAQISGRRDISFEERRRLDVYYVQHWSFWLDVIILLRTLRVVLTGKGAK